MFTLTISLDSLAVYIVLADIFILLIYILYIFNKKRRIENSIKTISEFIGSYFMNCGIEVQTTCFKLEGNRRYVVLIQSQPLKRFRCSNVLENNLIDHIQGATGNIVEKIYWRFPIRINKDLMIAAQKNSYESDDSYFIDGFAMTDDADKYNVSEVPWDQYERPKEKEEG